MTRVPSHLVGWTLPRGQGDGSDRIEAAVRCPCGNECLEFHSAGPSLAPALHRSFHCLARASCSCGQSCALFDNALHGWDVVLDLDRREKLHPLPLRPHRCPKCEVAEHRGTVRLKVMTDERRLILFSCGRLDESHRLDAFTAIEVDLVCCACGHGSPGWERYDTSAAELPTSEQASYRPLTMELTVLWDGERVGRIRVTGRHVQWPRLVGDFFPDPGCAAKAPLIAEAQRCLDPHQTTDDDAASDAALDRYLELREEIAGHVSFPELPVELDEVGFEDGRIHLLAKQRPLREHAHHHPPRCIRVLNPLPLTDSLTGVDAHGSTALFRVRCPCGERSCYLLGYFWEGEGPTPANIFVSPLALECPACGRVSELIDTRRHGFEGEQGCDCNMTGEGPRARFPCPRCGEAPFAVVPGFDYDGHDYDPLDPDARPEDFFGCFLLYGECGRCGQVVSVTGFECA